MHGYHPVTTDLEGILRGGAFSQLLVFGAAVNDVVDLVSEVMMVTIPPVELPQGIYWFSGVEPAVVLSVASGASPGASSSTAADAVARGSALDNALGWVDEAWESASLVSKPLFAVGDDVIGDSSGHDGVVRPGRRYVGGSWLYNEFEQLIVDLGHASP
jgi:hypothetical protein